MEIHAGDNDSVKTMLKDSRPVLMLYHMSMCPHCQILKPTWEKVKRKLKNNKGIIVAEVEYSNMTALPSNLRQIRGFPTIQVLENGKVKQEYFGDRSLASITEFATGYAIEPKAEKVAKPKPKTKKVAVRKT